MNTLLYKGTNITIVYNETRNTATIKSSVIHSRTDYDGMIINETQTYITKTIIGNDLDSLLLFFNEELDIWTCTENFSQILLTRLDNKTINVRVHGKAENISYGIQYNEITSKEI